MDDLDARGRDSARLAWLVALVAVLTGCEPVGMPRPGEPVLGEVSYRMIGPERAGEVPAGFDVRVYRAGGLRLDGFYLQSGRLPRERYEAAYGAWRGSHPSLPAMGDTVVLALRHDGTRAVVFDGFGYRSVEFLDPAGGTRTALPRDTIETLAAAGLAPLAPTDSVLGRVPVWTAMRIVSGHDTTLVGLAEIDSIWGPRALNPTAANQAATAAAGAAGVAIAVGVVVLLAAVIISAISLGTVDPFE